MLAVFQLQVLDDADDLGVDVLKALLPLQLLLQNQVLQQRDVLLHLRDLVDSALLVQPVVLLTFQREVVELLVDVLAPALNNLHLLVQLPLVVREVLDVLVQLLLHLLQQQRVLLVPALQALDVVLAESETY